MKIESTSVERQNSKDGNRQVKFPVRQAVIICRNIPENIRLLYADKATTITPNKNLLIQIIIIIISLEESNKERFQN